MVDLGRQLEFPQHIAKIILRSDMVLVAESVVMLEFTMPQDEHVEGAYEWKREKPINGCHR